jgi:predicted SnoaL-like aldol condensation-catalyzing enzyme
MKEAIPKIAFNRYKNLDVEVMTFTQLLSKLSQTTDHNPFIAPFDVFRFENGLIVEHWDNLLEVQKPNPSGRTQFDGATELTDLDKTAANKKVAKDFITNVLLNGEMDKVTT